MKKIKFILFLLAFMLVPLTLVACGGNSTPSTSQAGVDDLKAFVETLEFNDASVPYDGKGHNITFNGTLPDGYTYKVSPTISFVEPGNYSFDLEVSYNGKSATKTATLSIQKIKPTYVGATEFDLYLNDLSVKPEFVFNYNDVVVANPEDFLFAEAGDYTVELNSKVTSRYLAMDPVEITIHVHDNIYGLNLESKKIVLTGDVNEAVLEFDDVSELPQGYTVRYENNVQTALGSHKVTAYVLDDAGEIVETYRAILTVDCEDDPEFALYEHDMFVNEFIGDDQLSINIFFENPENYGIEHGDPTWYSYSPMSNYSVDDYQSDLRLLEEMRSELESFDYDKLSLAQQLSYKSIDSYITYIAELLSDRNNLIMRQSNVDQYGGSCADFPTDMEAYSFRTKTDIDDCLAMIRSAYDSFDTYYDFILEREEYGYGLSKFTLENFAEYLNGVVEAYDTSEEGYYLNRIMRDKLEAAQKELGFSDDVLNLYKENFDKALNDKTEGSKSLYLAHKDLAAKVTDYIADKKANGYLADKDYTGKYLGEYEGGKSLYYTMLKNRLGLGDLSPEEYVAELDSYLSTYSQLFRKYLSAIRADKKAQSISEGMGNFVEYETVYDLIDFLKEFAKTIVPDLESTPNIDVAYMDPTVTANTTTVAYYMKSPLDGGNTEYIHLNGSALKKNILETVRTLAHEGYPGHLYAYVYSKESDDLSDLVRINTSTGHGEGWAKYVENALCEYFIKLNNNAPEWEAAMRYNEYYDLFIYCFYARGDFGVNYQGWGVKEVAGLLAKYGLNEDAAEDVFHTFNEGPAQYAPYGYGFAVFDSLHNLAKEKLGYLYDEVEFNEVLLKHGWCGLTDLKSYVAEYLDEKMFVLGLE